MFWMFLVIIKQLQTEVTCKTFRSSAIHYFWLDFWSCPAWVDCSVIWALWSSPSSSSHRGLQREHTSTSLLTYPNERCPRSLGYEISGTMAAWHRLTAFFSLVQIILLLLLSARSSGRPLEKCLADRSCQLPRPPVVLSKYLLLV